MRIYFVPLDKLICKGEFSIQKNLDVHHLLSDDILTLEKVAGNLSFMLELNTRLKTFCILSRGENKRFKS